jgi:tetratricopeptide (TPR) repeat protein
MTHALPRWIVSLLVCALVALAPRAARAEDPAMRAAKRHFDRGEKLFALGKFDEALDEYQKAFDAKPIPEFLFNIGQCYRNLDQLDDAIFSFKKYLKLEPDAPNKPAVDKLIEELEDKRDRGEGARLTKRPPPVTSPPAEHKPIYKQWWFWTGVAVVGVVGSVGIYEGTKSGPPGTDLGNLVFGR